LLQWILQHDHSRRRPADLFEHAESAETRSILDTLLTSSRLYHKSADYKELLDFVR
jgi:hypothetical protein